MTDSEQITLYSCHLCGFCETSLSALTKHTASHIKSELPADQMTSSNTQEIANWKRMSFMPFASENQRDEESSGIVLVEPRLRDEDNRSRDNSQENDIETRQQQQGATESSRSRNLLDDDINDDDDDVIVLEENLRSPQIGDVFPSNSYPITTQSRVIFPSGWSETPQRSSIRMPNDPYRSTQQSNSAPIQGPQERMRTQIVDSTALMSANCRTSHSVSRSVDFSRGERHVASSRRENQSSSTIQDDRLMQYYQDDENAERMLQVSRSSNRSNIARPQNSVLYSNSNSSSLPQHAFKRPIRPKESRVLHSKDQYHSQGPLRLSLNGESPDNNLANSHYSAFSSFSSYKNNYRNNSEFVYQEDPSNHCNNPRVDFQRYHNEVSHHHQARQQRDVPSISPDAYMLLNDPGHASHPIPLPNNGTFIPNQGRPIVLPSSLYRNDVSGFLVVPIKNTKEMSVQTDESCLSMEFIPYQPPVARNSTSNSMQAVNEQASFEINDNGNGSNLNGPRSSSVVGCHVCNLEFPNEEKLKVHCDKFHSTESLNCRDCGRGFQSIKAMQLHRARVHNKRMPFRCGVCGLRFEDRSSVVQHLTTHNANEKTFDCQTCGKRFRSEEKLKNHMLKHKDMMHKCVECKKSFGSVATLQYHTAQFHKRQNKVGDSFERSGILTMPQDGGQSHSETRQTAVLETSASFQSVTGEQPLFTCLYCQTTFNDSVEFNQHSQECSLAPAKISKKMFRCAACPTFFTSKQELVNHYNSIHLTRDGYECSKCPRKFRLWSKLKLHIKDFHGLNKTTILKFPCKACTNKFSSQLKLDDHMRKIHQIPVKHERIYTCKECKKRFRNLSSLMVHRRGVHALNILESPSTQTWECPHCNIDRLTRKTYIAHLKEVHKLAVAEKGRSLEIIGKDTSEHVNESGQDEFGLPKDGTSVGTSVSSASELAQNKSNCHECGAEFSETKRLKNHLGLVHNQKPFSCEICDRKFSYSGQIVWHMKEHGDENMRKENSNEKSGISSLGNELSVDGDNDSKHQDLGEINQKQGNSTPSQNEFRSCTHCGMRFSDQKRLNNHLGVRHGYKNFTCDICDQRFSYSTHLIWHKRSHFSDKNKESANKITVEKVNMIDDQTSDQLVIAEGETGSTEKEKDTENLIKCDFCDEAFKDDESLQGHLKTHRKDSALDSQIAINKEPGFDENNEQQNTAKEAIMDSNNESNKDTAFNNEDRISTPDQQNNRYVCGQCDAEFDDRDLFQEHMVISHDAASSDVLSNNTRTTEEPLQENKSNRVPHNGFNCEICNKRLGTYIGWKVHRTRVHRLSNDKTEAQAAAFSYALQNYPTPVPQELDVNYTNQRELGSEDINSSAVFSCSKCSRIFTGLRNLRAHQFKAHSMKVKERNTKGSEAPESEQIESPLFAKVQEGKIFKCGTCDYQFSSEKGRRIHCKKMMHSEHARPANPSIDGNNKATIQDYNNISNMNDRAIDSPLVKKAKLDEDADAVISPCEICNIEFKNFQELRQHFQEKHPEEISFQTPNKNLASTPSWEQGINEKFLSKSAPANLGLVLGCPKCDRTFPTRKGLNTHLVKFHKIKGAAFTKWIQKSTIDGKTQEEIFGENYIESQSPPGSSSLMISNDTGHQRQPGGVSGHFMPTMVESLTEQIDQNIVVRKVCSICQRSFQNRRGLTMHMARFHHLDKNELRKFNIDLDLIAESEMSGDNMVAENSFKVVEKSPTFTEACPLCPLKFPSRRSLGTHIFKRHGIRCKRLSPAERRSLFSMNKPTTATENDPAATFKEKLIAIDCPICTGKFVGKRGVRAHVSRIHSLDKIELGFLFPEKYQTEDTVSKTCNHCNRNFMNIRIYAAHLYFVHKIEKDDTDFSVDADSKHVYRCNDLKCVEIFTSALDLLMHIRAKNGRDINHVDIEVVNPDPSSINLISDQADDVIEDYDDFGEDDDVVVDVNIEEDGDVDQDNYEGFGNEELTREDSQNTHSSESQHDLLPCFLCKLKFPDEASFKVHYEKAHAGINANEAENVLDLIERSRLQNDAISKEYSLRATASRKAFRSEIEYTEHYLSSPKPCKQTCEITDTGKQSDQMEYEDEFQSPNKVVILQENGKDLTGIENEDTLKETGCEGEQTEKSKKNFFAAALDLRVTP